MKKSKLFKKMSNLLTSVSKVLNRSLHQATELGESLSEMTRKTRKSRSKVIRTKQKRTRAKLAPRLQLSPTKRSSNAQSAKRK
jgi:hypothetical protein